jgi:hypothetical protein
MMERGVDSNAEAPISASVIADSPTVRSTESPCAMISLTLVPRY